jgi:hypothetical protein
MQILSPLAHLENRTQVLVSYLTKLFVAHPGTSSLSLVFTVQNGSVINRDHIPAFRIWHQDGLFMSGRLSSASPRALEGHEDIQMEDSGEEYGWDDKRRKEETLYHQ